MTKAGAERQKYQQSMLDYPLTQAANVAGLMRGYQVPISDVKKFVGPEAGAYQLSPLQQATGLLGVIGAGTTGTAVDRIKSLYDKFLSGSATSAETAELISNAYNDPSRSSDIYVPPGGNIPAGSDVTPPPGE
jgi:hypothetical protein